MQSLRFRLAAGSTFVLLAIGLGLMGLLIASWIVPVLLVLAHDGPAGIRSINVVEKVFPDAPQFLSEPVGRWFTWLNLFPGIAGFLIGLVRGGRYWRRLVVAQGWMTHAEAMKVLERDDGF
jgi:hypothetical protein